MVSGVMPPVTRIAVDIGGTFTDVAVLSGSGRLTTRKIPSTPHDYAQAVMRGIRELLEELDSPVAELREILHGCTVATNAILEQKGAKTALLTTKGFRDVLEIQRVRVPTLYNPLYVRPPPLVPRNLRFEVEERLDAQGNVLTPLHEADIRYAIERIKAAGVEAVAVCYLHSYANPQHERRTGELLAQALPDHYVSLSVDVLPQKREYERTSTTVINSYVGPPVQAYLESLMRTLRGAEVAGRLLVMQSNGGILDADTVITRPAQVIECGPAAGVVGAGHVARHSGFDNIITLDMGGTTAKASIVTKGELIFADSYGVGGGMSSRSALNGGGGYALALPVIEISEVGAGGGSIAWVDRGGSLKIGPHSAGAVPGPACYGAGNLLPTVTDANVILGYLNPSALAGGTVPIDIDLARRAVSDHVAKPLGVGLVDAAYGIHAVANANMMRAVKAVTTYRGRDPRDFSLFAFGGNGGVHAAGLARVLQTKEIMLPVGAGVFSALGLLFSDFKMNETAPFLHLAADLSCHQADLAYQTLADRIGPVLGERSAIQFERFADARFAGQAFELTIPIGEGPLDTHRVAEFCDRFVAEHTRRYGHAFSGRFPVEVVNLRLVGTRAPDGHRGLPDAATGVAAVAGDRTVHFGPGLGSHDCPIIARSRLGPEPLRGPFILEEYEGTAVVPPGAAARTGSAGTVIIELTPQKSGTAP
jgi:N-methylhydantoinase A